MPGADAAQHQVVKTLDAAKAPLASAVDEIVHRDQLRRLRQLHRTRFDRCIALADRLVDGLERLALADQPEVPAAWRSHLDRLLRELPDGVTAELPTGLPPAELLDRIFDVQDQLFRLKLGELAVALREADAELDAAG